MSDNDTFYKAATVEEVGDRTFKFIASDETPDSYGDIVRVAGWDLKRYKKNPIVLFGHDSRQPIGWSPEVVIDEKKKQLQQVIKLADEGTSEFIDTLYKLMKQRIVKAVSVGFRSLAEPNILRDKDGDYSGMEFISQELLELSVVSIPANPNALSLAKSWNTKDATMARLFGKDAIVQNANNARRLALLRLGASS